MRDDRTGTEKAYADLVIWRAMEMMNQDGIPYEVMMDRLLTAAGAQIARREGAEAAEKAFRSMADNIAAGVLKTVERRTTAN